MQLSAGSRRKEMIVSRLYLPLPALSTPMGFPSISAGLTNHSQHQNNTATTCANNTVKQQLEGPHAPGSFGTGSSTCAPDQLYVILDFFYYVIQEVHESLPILTQPRWLLTRCHSVWRAAHLIKVKKCWELSKKLKVCTHLIFKIFFSNWTMTQVGFYFMPDFTLKGDTI